MNRFNATQGGRGGSPSDFSAGASSAQRAGFGAEQNPAGDLAQSSITSSLPGNPHSSSGFRRALMRTARTSGRLKDQLPQKQTFGGKGFRKPNYFAQGAGRHGMHIGSGAPAINPANLEGADAGGQ